MIVGVAASFPLIAASLNASSYPSLLSSSTSSRESFLHHKHHHSTNEKHLQSETFGAKEKHLETSGKANISTLRILAAPHCLTLPPPVIVTHLGVRGKRGEIFGTFRVIRRKCVRFVTEIAFLFVSVASIAFLLNMVGSFSESGGDLVVGD